MFFKKIIIENFIVEKLKSFRQLQESFKQTTFLMHFFDEKILYVDIDVSKRRDFETIIYHLKFNCLNLEKLKRVDIESILFFNRILNIAKTKYWSTKLKMTKLIWVIRRIRHIIETTKYITIIFTNHFVNIFIVKQITLASININKLNLRLIRVSIYLSQFRLDIKYKFDKKHVISNVLSCFSSNNELVVVQLNSKNILDFDIYHNDVINSFCSK